MGTTVNNIWSLSSIKTTSWTTTIPLSTITGSGSFALFVGAKDGSGSITVSFSGQNFTRMRNMTGINMDMEVHIANLHHESINVLDYGTSTNLPEPSYASGLGIGKNGTRLYVGDSTNREILQYNLSTAYDPATAVFTRKINLLSLYNSNLSGFGISSDGSTITWADSSADFIHSAVLATPWELIPSSHKSFDTNDLYTTGAWFNPSGSQLISSHHALYYLVVYPLSTAFDINSRGTPVNVSYNEIFPSQIIRNVTFSADNKYMYLSGSTTIQLTLGVRGDATTIIHNGIRVPFGATGSSAVVPSDNGGILRLYSGGDVSTYFSNGNIIDTDVTLGTTSEEYAYICTEFIEGDWDSIRGIEGGLATFAQGDSSIASVAPATDSDGTVTRITHAAYDNGNLPFTYNLTTRIDDIQSTGGGSGSIGVGMAGTIGAHSLQIPEIHGDSARDWCCCDVLVDDFVADDGQYVDITATIQLLADITVEVDASSVMHLVSQTTALINSGWITHGSVSMVTSSQFQPALSPLVVTDYRFEEDVTESTTAWLCDNNQGLSFDGEAVSGLGITPILTVEYSVAVHNIRVRFLVKNTDTGNVEFRPYAQYNQKKLPYGWRMPWQQSATNSEERSKVLGGIGAYPAEGSSCSAADEIIHEVLTGQSNGYPAINGILSFLGLDNITMRYLYIFEHDAIDYYAFHLDKDNNTIVLDTASVPAGIDAFGVRVWESDPTTIWVIWIDYSQTYAGIMTSTNGYTWTNVPAMYGTVRRYSTNNGATYASIIVNNQKYISQTYSYNDDKRTYIYRWKESTSEWIILKYKIYYGFYEDFMYPFTFLCQHPTNSNIIISGSIQGLVRNKATANYIIQIDTSTDTIVNELEFEFTIGDVDDIGFVDNNYLPFDRAKIIGNKLYLGRSACEYEAIYILYDLATNTVELIHKSPADYEEFESFGFGPDLFSDDKLNNSYLSSQLNMVNAQGYTTRDHRDGVLYGSQRHGNLIRSDVGIPDAIFPSENIQRELKQPPVPVNYASYSKNLDPSIYNDYTYIPGMFIDSSTNESVSIYIQVWRESGVSAPNITTTHTLSMSRTPCEYREPTIQKMGTGVYTTPNKGLLRYGFDTDPICVLGPLEEVEVSVPLYVYFDDYRIHDDSLDSQESIGQLAIRLQDFNNLINTKKSVEAVWASTRAGSTLHIAGKFYMDSSSSMSGTYAIGTEVNMLSDTEVSFNGLRDSSSSVGCNCNSSVRVVASNHVLEVVKIDYQANPADTNYGLSYGEYSYLYELSILDPTGIIIDEPYVKDMDSFGLVHDDIFNDDYGRIRLRWMIANNSDSLVSILPRIQQSTNGGAWTDIDVNGGNYAPISLEAFHGEKTIAANTSPALYNSLAWDISSNPKMFTFDKGTHWEVLFRCLTDNLNHVLIVKATIDKSTDQITSLIEMQDMADDLDNYPFYTTSSSFIGVNTVSVDNGNFIGLVYMSYNEQNVGKTVYYDSATDLTHLVVIPSPATYSLDIETVIYVRTIGGEVLAVVDNSAYGEYLWICHFDKTTRLYDPAVIMSIPGFAPGTFQTCTNFADPATNVMKVVFLELTTDDMYETDYDPVGKTFTTPIFLVNAITAGLGGGAPWNVGSKLKTAKPTITDASGVVHIYLVIGPNSDGSLWTYDAINGFTIIESLMSIGGVSNAHFDMNDNAIIYESSTNTYSISKYVDTDPYYRVMSYKTTPYAWGKRFVMWSNTANEFKMMSFTGYGTVNLNAVLYSSGIEFTDQNDVPQLMSSEPYVSSNTASLILHKVAKNPIVIPAGSTVEVFTAFKVFWDWMDPILNGSTDQNLRVRLFDDTETIDNREHPFTINLLPAHIQTGNLDVASETVVVFKGNKISSESECYMISNTEVVFVGTKETIVEPSCDMIWSITTDLVGNKDLFGLFVYPLTSDSNFIGTATITFGDNTSFKSESITDFSSSNLLAASISMVSDSETLFISHRNRYANLSLQTETITELTPSKDVTGLLDVLSDSHLELLGLKNSFGVLSLLSLSSLIVKPSRDILASLDILSSSNFNSLSARNRGSFLNLISDSSCVVDGFRTRVGRLSLGSFSLLKLEGAAELVSTVSFASDSTFNSALSWNDNRDIILFSSNIERVVEFTLYDNDTNFVQDITTNYPVTWDMSKLNTFDLQINQLQSFDSYIDQVREFELQSVELEPQLFIGDITVKSEYDLNIVSNLSLVSEINTLITYNMQIDKVSDKEILLGL